MISIHHNWTTYIHCVLDKQYSKLWIYWVGANTKFTIWQVHVYQHRGYSMFYLWIWNLFNEWDKVFYKFSRLQSPSKNIQTFCLKNSLFLEKRLFWDWLTYCRAFGSGATAICFDDFGLSRMQFEKSNHPIAGRTL